MLEIRHRHEHARMPWRNGGGVTFEVARSPTHARLEDFDWRVSIAEVASDGPFSAYPGVQRVIMLLDGAWMGLRVDGVRRRLAPLEPFMFDGASVTSCEIPSPTRDLNVMTRRGRASACVELIRLGPAAQTLGADPLLLVCVRGSVTVATPDDEREELGVLDVARSPDPGPFVLAGEGAVAAIRVEAAGHERDGHGH